jgi:hypothetical protein
MVTISKGSEGGGRQAARSKRISAIGKNEWDQATMHYE